MSKNKHKNAKPNNKEKDNAKKNTDLLREILKQ